MLALITGLLSLGLVIGGFLIAMIGALWILKVVCMTLGYVIILLKDGSDAPTINEFIKEWEQL